MRWPISPLSSVVATAARRRASSFSFMASVDRDSLRQSRPVATTLIACRCDLETLRNSSRLAGVRMGNIAARTFALIDQALGWFATNVWVYFGILWDALVVCRASVVMAAAGWLLLASEQGQDVLLALAQSVGSDDGPGWHGYPLLIVTLLFLSFWMISTWYWALTMLRFDLPRWTPYKRE